jgi:hypothetical protein
VLKRFDLTAHDRAHIGASGRARFDRGTECALDPVKVSQTAARRLRLYCPTVTLGGQCTARGTTHLVGNGLQPA